MKLTICNISEYSLKIFYIFILFINQAITSITLDSVSNNFPRPSFQQITYQPSIQQQQHVLQQPGYQNQFLMNSQLNERMGYQQISPFNQTPEIPNGIISPNQMFTPAGRKLSAANLWNFQRLHIFRSILVKTCRKKMDLKLSKFIVKTELT